jgi:hypothetical protein
MEVHGLFNKAVINCRSYLALNNVKEKEVIVAYFKLLAFM